MLGIGPGAARFLWLLIAVLLVGISIVFAYRAARKLPESAYRCAQPPWLLLLGVSIFLGVMVVFPVTFFGDEDLIALPTLIIASMLAHVLTWPGLTILVVLLLAVLRSSFRYLRDWHVWIFAALVLLSSIVLAVIHTHPEALTIRYPSLFHFVQFIVTVFTQGSPELFRLGNVVWVFVLGLVAWFIPSQWSPSARIAAALALCLTPLGWTYHILLYQACGELTIGFLAVFLLGRVCTDASESESPHALLLGSTLSFWILYRPTSFALACACIALLIVVRRRRAAWIVASISFPIGVLWISVYLFGSFQYPFLSTESTRSFQIVAPLVATLRDLPDQLHPIGLLVLVAGSVLALWKRPVDRPMLLCAWFLGLVYTGVHQLLTIDVWYGYGRFNTLLMLPLGITVGSLVMLTPKKQHLIAAVVLLLVLVSVTPWTSVGFLQSYRSTRYLDVGRMERTVTGGVAPFPIPRVMEDVVAHADTLMFLSPSSSFLDLLIARGLISIAQRSAIIARGKLWTPASPDRPVIIQAPADGKTFVPNITAAQEQRLRDAAAWARLQPGVKTYRLGQEEALLVP